ncbi:MAG: flagellar hook protein FlgE [Desulfobacterales bacterium]|jgi:flagellar hook protein FlgE
MIGSLFAGISGLNANATAMTVIGDNIANVNTTAFKTNRSSFANILSQSLGGATGNDIGRGVEFWGTSPLWTQGSLENTSSPTDLAINGKGFFIVNDSSGASFYTRAGQFYLNEVGDMVNPDGLIVQGYEIDANGNLGNLTNVSIPGERVAPPQVTSTFTFDINLDAGAAVNDTYSTSQTVYDTLGNAIPLTLTFTNQAPGQWQVDAAIPSGTVTIGGAANITMNFDPNGALQSPLADQSLVLDFGGGSTQTVNWDLIDDASGAPYGDLTGYASPSTTTFQYQDGYPSGVLRGISVDENGVVTASYSNGQLSPVFQIAMADFPSYEGLTKMGKNLYAESLSSGQPMPGTAGNGRLGGITPMAIEMSNVDLAQEFVKMITTQRAFQANSKVITTSDEILSELINIKR